MYAHQYANFLVLLQVKSGTIFDNFLVTSDDEYASEYAKETFEVTKVCLLFFAIIIKYNCGSCLYITQFDYII